jgi:hypothetical protein
MKPADISEIKKKVYQKNKIFELVTNSKNKYIRDV